MDHVPTSPRTEAPVETAQSPDSTPHDTLDSVREKIARARAAQETWARTPIRQRSRAMLRVRDYVAAHADELSATISRDNGKTRVDAISTEVLPAAVAAAYYARHAKRFLSTRRLASASFLMMNKRSRLRRVPWGVVGIISPWNYPFGIPFSEVVMGLLAGNAVLLKVASQTPLVGQALARCFAAGELPDGLFANLTMPGPQASDALLSLGVDKLFFTGSTAVGKQLMAKAAESLTPLCLELGGNDAMLVCPDADLDRAAAGAVWAGFSNCGQSCAGVERIYVHADVFDAFIERLSQRVARLRVGRDTQFDVDLGAMTTVAQSDKVRQHIQDALDRGATIAAQSDCPPKEAGNFLPATVLAHVDHSMLAMREETFGPVVGVMKVESMDQAVQLANDSIYGLTGSVWSRDRKSARRWAERLQAGAVMINDHLMSHGLAETPWGGFKQSSIGRTHGEIGFAEMTQPQCIVDDLMPAVRKNLWWHPHSRDVYDTMTGAIDMLYARRWSRRFGGCMRVLKNLPRIFQSK